MYAPSRFPKPVRAVLEKHGGFGPQDGRPVCSSRSSANPHAASLLVGFVIIVFPLDVSLGPSLGELSRRRYSLTGGQHRSRSSPGTRERLFRVCAGHDLRQRARARSRANHNCQINRASDFFSHLCFLSFPLFPSFFFSFLVGECFRRQQAPATRFYSQIGRSLLCTMPISYPPE